MEAASSEPPFEVRYGEIFCNSSSGATNSLMECDLPLVDLRLLSSENDQERESCMAAMAQASSEWGFFQVINHGISRDLLDEMKREQKTLFEMPFEKKPSCCNLLNGSYRWGTPAVTNLTQLSWSEAFHVPLSNLSSNEDQGFKTLRGVMQRYAGAVSALAARIARVLAEKLGEKGKLPTESCSESTCFLRLNRYPRCRFSQQVFGLVPHTDSDFLTVLHQDQVGGLELMKDSRWVAVRPNPQALIVNIGDLFQAWSCDVYKSVEHRVIACRETERYSVAYFMCPSLESVIDSHREPSPYRKFSFGEYRSQVQADVNATGHKVGLPRFLR